jgi:hypothetical protein
MNTNKPELPRVGDMRTDLLTAEDRRTEVIEVGDTTPVQLVTATGDFRFTRVCFEVEKSNTGGVFIGGPDVKNDAVAMVAGQKRGRFYDVGDSREEDTTLAPYAIAQAGKTVFLVCEWVR